jgi:phage gpG-like protein
LLIKSVKISFDPRKLEKELKSKLIDETMQEYTDMVAKTTKSDLESSKDIHGQSFKPIKPVTREIRKLRGFTGTKPLIQSGDMKNSIQTKKIGKNKYVLDAIGYGSEGNNNVHQTGFTLSNPKQYKFEVEGEIFTVGKAKIPARPWFPDQDSVENSASINKSFEEIAKDFFKKFNKAFTKRGFIG